MCAALTTSPKIPGLQGKISAMMRRAILATCCLASCAEAFLLPGTLPMATTRSSPLVASCRGVRRLTAQQQSTEAAPAADAGVPKYEKKFPFDAPPPKDGDYIDMFCRGTNDLMKKAVVQSFRDKVEMKPAGTAGPELIDRLLAAPEFPGMSRPLWMVMAGSIPTALGWYGYYKFSVEEELFQVRRLLGQKGSLGFSAM